MFKEYIFYVFKISLIFSMICFHNFLFPFQSELVFKDGVSMLNNRELSQFEIQVFDSRNQKYLRNTSV